MPGVWVGGCQTGLRAPHALSRALKGRQVSGDLEGWQAVWLGWYTKRGSSWWALPRPLSILFAVEC